MWIMWRIVHVFVILSAISSPAFGVDCKRGAFERNMEGFSRAVNQAQSQITHHRTLINQELKEQALWLEPRWNQTKKYKEVLALSMGNLSQANTISIKVKELLQERADQAAFTHELSKGMRSYLLKNKENKASKFVERQRTHFKNKIPKALDERLETLVSILELDEDFNGSLGERLQDEFIAPSERAIKSIDNMFAVIEEFLVEYEMTRNHLGLAQQESERDLKAAESALADSNMRISQSQLAIDELTSSIEKIISRKKSYTDQYSTQCDQYEPQQIIQAIPYHLRHNAT